MPTGIKPSRRASIHPKLVRLVDAQGHGASVRLARQIGINHRAIFSVMLRHTFPLHALTIERVSKLATILHYDGPLFREEAQ